MNEPYTQELEARVKEWSRGQQSPKRFAHTRRVVETVTHLAKLWSPHDTLLCRVTAWIHDAAKQYDDATLLTMARERNLSITDFERQNPMLLHGVVAYALAAQEFSLDDQRIQTACAYHTSGAAEMTLLDRLVFLADKIEPSREFPGVEEIRKAAEINLDHAVWLFVEGNIRFLIDRRKSIDPRAIELYNTLIFSGAAAD